MRFAFANGKELAEHLKIIMPEIKILFMSDYIDDFMAQKESLVMEFFLQKPFTPARMISKVREVLDSSLLCEA